MKAHPDSLLHTLVGGPFDEAARLLQTAIASGAVVRPSTDTTPSKELRNTYNVRRKHMLEANIHMPGFDLVTDLLNTYPNGAWWLIGVDGARIGGVILLSDDTNRLGCFAYRVPQT